MTADWYLFWKQNNERPELGDYDLHFFILGHSAETVGRAIGTALLPAFVTALNRISNLLIGGASK